jgi:hypothetical protein
MANWRGLREELKLPKYQAMSDGAAAADLNTQINDEVEFLENHQIFEAMVPSEYQALALADRQYVELMLAMQTVNIGPDSQARAFLTASFGAGTTTRANLIALVPADQTTRALQVFGAPVTEQHVATARAS